MGRESGTKLKPPPKPKIRICEAFKRNLGVSCCSEKFEKRKMGQKVCGIPCSMALAKDDRQRDAKRTTKQKRREFRENDLSWWKAVDAAEANKNGGNTPYWLHRWIRLVRDVNKPCISCGKLEDWQWHAGHYRSRGAAGHLRFNPDNIHKQCHQCNTRGNADTGAKMRKNMVERIGEARVMALDNNSDLKRWTIEECREIRDKYRDLCKEAGV